MADHDQALFVAYYNNPSPALKNDILESHQGLVKHLARKMAFDRTHLEDIIQIANIGLLKAIERFDPNQNNNFVGFAIPTIVGEIKHYIRDSLAIIRIPRTVQENDCGSVALLKNTRKPTANHPPLKPLLMRWIWILNRYWNAQKSTVFPGYPLWTSRCTTNPDHRC